MRFDSDGKLLVSGTGGSGGGGSTDMTATNQKLDEIKAHVDELEAIVAQLRDRTPVSGQTTAAYSSPVTLSTDGLFATNFGAATDPAATSDDENVGFLRLFKRHLKRLTTLIGLMPTVPLQNNRIASLPTSISKYFRDEFVGSTLNLTNWEIIQTGVGQNVSVSASELNITSGTTANSETILRSKTTYNLPCRILAIAKLSQRIINQEFYLEFVDSTGQDYASWQFFGTNAQTAHYATGTAGDASGYSAITTGSATNVYQIFESELFQEECYFYTRSADSNTFRGTSVGVRSRKIPDTNRDYYLQIRAKNLATAPASSTAFTLDSIAIVDIERLSAEVVGGRGGGASNSAITIAGSVGLSSGATVLVSESGAYNTEFNSPFIANQNSVGSSRDALNKTVVRGWIHSDQSGTMYVDQSADNTTWRTLKEFTKIFTPTAPGTPESSYFEFKLAARYYRIRYINNNTAQAAMQLVTAAFTCN